MNRSYIRNISKVLKSAANRMFGAGADGVPTELTASDARTLLEVYSASQVDTALTGKADLSGGLIPSSQIPAIAVTEYLGSVASQSAMLALVGDRGDWCLRSDLGTSWVLSADDSSLIASWTQLLYPTAPVTSVADRTGAITLSNTDISGLGTLATQSGTFSGTSSGTNTGDQDLSGYVLTTAIDTLAELNTIVTDATLIDTGDSRLSDARTPTVHASSHVSGADDIQSATAAQKGLMTSAAMTKLDGIASGANLYVHPNHSGAMTSTADGATALGSFDLAALNTALSDADVATGGGTATGTNTGDQNLFSTIVVAGQSNVVADSASDTLTLVAGTNITITTDAATDTITIAASGGGLSGTGSVDNAVLRADGTGGATLQNSAWVIADNATASPNNTVNHACIEATGGTTNVSVSIKPKGTGAFSLSAPDGAATGGNARGANAVDLQTIRSAATQVASGLASFVGGEYCTASGRDAFCWGYSAIASGEGSVCLTLQGTATASYAFSQGYQTDATANGAFATGFRSLGRLNYGRFLASGQFAARGDAQALWIVARNKTTNATPTRLYLDDYGNLANHITVPSGKIMCLSIRVSGIRSNGTAVAEYWRRVRIKNIGGTTSLIGTVETIGTDYEDNASTDISITADNTNDAVQIDVTGIAAETWRWVAIIDGTETAYGA